MKYLVFVAFVGLAIAATNDTAPENPAPQPPPQPPTLIPSNSTTTSTTPSTPKTTTPTVPPNPNTTISTTTSTTTASTTTTTTTAAPSTTTSKPAPPPKPRIPDTGHWFVNYTDGKGSCIVLQSALQIQIPYHPKNNINQTYHASVDVPKNATASGKCNPNEQSITLQWNTTVDQKNVTNQVVVFFRNSSKTYELDFVNVTIFPDSSNFPDFNGTDKIVLIHNHSDFSTSVSKSYKCDKEQKLNLTESASNKTVGYLYLSHTQLQAFHNSTNGQFESAEDCEPFDTPDIVPLAVGCALAGLVIIVLIAYLIGRKRAQARGYLSM